MEVRQFEKLRSKDDRFIITEFWVDPSQGDERDALKFIETKVKEFCATSINDPIRYKKDNDPFRWIVIEEIK
ncbi:MAG: hypothetical protein NXI20_00645 [bacterium]|nr:hypothetical protein [bacterium]